MFLWSKLDLFRKKYEESYREKFLEEKHQSNEVLAKFHRISSEVSDRNVNILC